MPPVAPREAARRLTHAGAGLLALLLRFLPWPVVPICCMGGIAMNFVILPKIAPHIFRPQEGKFSGVRAYPMAVLLLVLLFPMRTAAGAWGILAFGDASAALVGRSMGKHKLPWNRDKSWEGLFAFILFGTLAGAMIYYFVEAREPKTFGWFGEIYNFFGERPWLQSLNAHFAFNTNGPDYAAGATSRGLSNITIWTAALAASAAASAAESIRVKVDDNFRTALAAGAVLLYLDPLTKVIQAMY